ncbi:uncharacterized protein LOC134826631 isoform X2 [Bolinopsis microptera]|uniref:uncharacterized protein LOC134826631 isoform X2 n=1 Tax=Bolinopsis microptera TaxID=2820187 RepID=UPI00307A56A1
MKGSTMPIEDQFYGISGNELHVHPSASRQQPPDRPRMTGRRPRTNTRSGSGSGSEEPHANHNGDTATSMVYLNMSSEERYIDTPTQVRVQTRPSNGSSQETNLYNDPSSVHERQQSEIEMQFPSHTVVIPEDNVSEVSKEMQIQSDTAKPTIVRFQREQEKTTCEDYMDLPGPHSVILLFIFLGIAFVTGVLTMVIYTAVDPVNEGATVKVLCLMIIIPVFFFSVTCGLNCYGWYLGHKLESEA